MKTLVDQKGRNLLCGTITEIIEGKGSVQDRLVSIRVKTSEWDSTRKENVEYLYEIAFWNSEDATKKQMMTRFNNCNFQVNDFISVLFYPKSDDEPFKGNAIDFKKRGLWSLNDGKLSVIIGNVINARIFGEEDNKSTSVTVPYRYWDRATETETDKFLSINFNNKYRNLQQPAYDVLCPRETDGKKTYKFCVITSGEIKENARGYLNTYGKSFEVF